MAKLTTKTRNAIPSKDFAFPEDRSYPIENESHARNALSRGSANLSAKDDATLKRKVHAKYPDIEVSHS